MNAAGIEFRAVSKRYGGGDAPLAVDAIDFSVPKGTLTTILGPSGCGKTTTLRMIAGLETPTSGRILIAGRDVTDLPASERDVSMVFQSYALFPHMDVLANVGYGLAVAGVPRDQAKARAQAAMAVGRPRRHGPPDDRASSRAASSSASRWPARWCSSRRCCSSTSRCRISMRACAARCARRSAACSSASA